MAPAYMPQGSTAPEYETASYLAQSNAAAILTFVGICGAIALTILLLRLYVRRFMLRFIGADDVCMIVAMLCGIGVFICFLGEISHGLGRHIQAVSATEFEAYLHWEFVHQILVFTGHAFCKISICLLLIRLVKHRRFVYFLWALLIFFALYSAVCVLIVVFACFPTSSDWTLGAHAKCLSTEAFVVLAIINSAVNIATDLLLALLPIPVIVGMTLNKRTKIALCIVMSLGVIAVGAAAVKLHAELTAYKNPDQGFKDNYLVWAAVELYFGISCASAPILKPLVSAFLNKTARGSRSPRSRDNATPRIQQWPGSHKAGVKSIDFGDYSTQCTSGGLTPYKSKDSESDGYFGVFKKSASNYQIDCSRADSIQLGTLSFGDDSLLQRQMTTEKDGKACIVRTRQVVTVSEPVEVASTSTPDMPRPTLQLSRQSSREGESLRRTSTHGTSSPEGDVGDGESIKTLISN